jgi:phage terminase small subunit
MGQLPVNAESTPRPLSGREALFVAEYQKDHNATQAAIRAGYSAKTAKQQGSRLLTRDDVRRAVDEQTAQRIAQAAHETGITLERTLREIARGAFFDVRKLFRENGEPLPVTELDDDTASVIAGLETATERSRTRGSDSDVDESTFVRKYKLADRKGYLDMLMKHLGGYAKDNEQAKPDAPVAVVPGNEMARELAYALHLGLKNASTPAANDAKSPNPRQAAS